MAAAVGGPLRRRLWGRLAGCRLWLPDPRLLGEPGLALIRSLAAPDGRARGGPLLRLALQVLDRPLQSGPVGTARDRAWQRDSDFEPQLVGSPGAPAAEVLEQVVAVGVIDAVALDEVPLDSVGLVVAVVERVVHLSDLGVDEQADPLAATLRIPVEHLRVDHRSLPLREGLVIDDRREAGLNRGGDLEAVLGPVQAHSSLLSGLGALPRRL